MISIVVESPTLFGMGVGEGNKLSLLTLNINTVFDITATSTKVYSGDNLV